MEEGDFGKQRRNVFVISLIIITYNVAAGDLSNFSFYGVGLRNVWALIIGVWVAFGYVVLRFMLYAKFSTTQTPGIGQVTINRAFAIEFFDYVKFKPLLASRLQALFADDLITINQQRENTRQAPESFEPRNIKLIHERWFLPWRVQYQGAANFRHDLGYFMVIRTLVRYGFPFMLKNPRGTDVLLPYLMSATAVVVAILGYFGVFTGQEASNVASQEAACILVI